MLVAAHSEMGYCSFYKKWYQYIYSKTELDTILTTIKKLNADKKAMYLNNDHGMLENGLYLLKTLQQVELK